LNYPEPDAFITRDKEVKLVSLRFTDILGFLKSFSIIPGELEGVFENGVGFDGSSISLAL